MQDEDKNGRHQKTCEAHIRVVQHHPFVGQGTGKHIGLGSNDALLRETLHLYVLPHLQGYIVAGQHHGPVVQKTAHVAVDRNMGLFAALEQGTEIGRNGQHAMNRSRRKLLTGFLKAGASAVYGDIGAGIHVTDKLTRKAGIGRIDYGDGHVQKRFIPIESTVKSKIFDF